MDDALDAEIANITLRSGLSVLIRPIRPDDAPRLQALHARLSPDSVYFRFLDQRKVLSDAEAHYLANVDYQTKMALVAALDREGEEHLIGVARYGVVGAAEAGIAEAAIVVEDQYQSQGLGTLLFIRLLQYARSRGIREFQGTIHSANNRILQFVQRGGIPVKRKFIDGVWEIQANLEDSPDSTS